MECFRGLKEWAVPRGCDRARLYVYLTGRVSRAVDLHARDNDGVVKPLVLASLTNGYVEGAASFLKLCGQTVRNHLTYQDPSRLIQVNADVIREMRLSGVLSKPLLLAIDWHDEMYYGDPSAEGVIGTQPKKGSHHAYRFATASVLIDGERVTLAVVPLTDGRVLAHVKELITSTFELGVKVKFILFDRGYFSADLINHLNSLAVHYIIQLPSCIRGLGEAEDFMYTTRSHKRRKSEQATFRLVTVKGRDKSGKDVVFIFGTNTQFSRGKIRKLFRKRWGIETSYRMIHKFLAKTISKRYTVRKLCFYLAVLLYNLWILLNYHKATITVDALKLHVTLTLILSLLPDLEGLRYERDKF